MGKKYANFRVNLDDIPEDPRWYTIVTQYNYEQYVVNSIKKIIDNKTIFESFSGIREIVTEKVNRKGECKKVIKNEKIMPNYVFVKAVMTIDTWNILTNLTGVSAVLCTSGVPVYTDQRKIDEMKTWLGEV